MSLELIPIRLRDARRFIHDHHRHNKPPRGWLFGVGLKGEDGGLVGVAVAGRPSARSLDDGLTIEVTRTCTLGIRNANSMLYGAVWRAARSLGYRRAITYTRQDESGISLRAAGWTLVANLPPRDDWAGSSVKLHDLRHKTQADMFIEHRAATGDVARYRWEIAA